MNQKSQNISKDNFDQLPINLITVSGPPIIAGICFVVTAFDFRVRQMARGAFRLWNEDRKAHAGVLYVVMTE